MTANAGHFENRSGGYGGYAGKNSNPGAYKGGKGKNAGRPRGSKSGNSKGGSKSSSSVAPEVVRVMCAMLAVPALAVSLVIGYFVAPIVKGWF